MSVRLRKMQEGSKCEANSLRFAVSIAEFFNEARGDAEDVKALANLREKLFVKDVPYLPLGRVTGSWQNNPIMDKCVDTFKGLNETV